MIKDGNVFAVAAPDGSLTPDGPYGLWMDDQRFLGRHELRVDGERPSTVSASDDDGDRAVHELAAGATRITLDRRVDALGSLDERITLDPPGVVTLDLDADFAAMLAVRGIVPMPAGPVAGGPPAFSRRGADGVTRTTRVSASPEPEVDGSRLRFPPAGEIRIRYELQPAPPRRRIRRAPPSATRVTLDDPRTDALLQRSLGDLAMLRSTLDGHDHYVAGIPWYATLFGRDSLIAALQALAFSPHVAAGTLRLLAARLGTRHDPEREEEPGKVLHELRVGEAAAPGATPLARYYGTVDATPLALCLLAEHASWTGSLDLFHELRPAVDAMLDWLDRQGELLAYAAHSPAGLRNQGWKDSAEGVIDERGAPLEPPIALIEAQAYGIRARRQIARLHGAAGDHEKAAALDAAADAATERLERFWLPGRTAYSMAIGADGRASRALASNQGHLLWAVALPPHRAAAVRDRLMSPELFSGWGIRTLADTEPAYDPLGYHLGTVWPHDTALAAAGLRTHGFVVDFMTLFDALIDAAAGSPGRRLPELFGGARRTPGTASPVPYRVACRPQAWAAGTLPHLLTHALGLEARGLQRRLHVRRPVLPAGVHRVEVTGLEIAGARVYLRVERDTADGAAAGLVEARVEGDLDVVAEAD